MNLSYISGMSFKLMWAKSELLISSLTLEISQEIELSLEETHREREREILSVTENPRVTEGNEN